MFVYFVVVFQHIPPFVKVNTKYTNTKYDRRLKMLDKLREAGVKYVFCGHYHKNAEWMYKDLEVVVTSAIGAPLGEDPSGYRIVNVGKEKITHEYVALKDSINFEMYAEF